MTLLGVKTIILQFWEYASITKIITSNLGLVDIAGILTIAAENNY